MIKVLHFIYYPLMNLLWIILGILCLLKATRSSVLLSPTPEVRRIKVIYYYLCAVILLVFLGTNIFYLSLSKEFVRSHCPFNADRFYILMICLIAPVYCTLSHGVNQWIHRRISVTQSDSGHRAAPLDKYVDRAYLAAMASVFFVFVPSILYFSLFYSGLLFFSPMYSRSFSPRSSGDCIGSTTAECSPCCAAGKRPFCLRVRISAESGIGVCSLGILPSSGSLSCRWNISSSLM